MTTLSPPQSDTALFPKILFVHDYRPEARALTDLMRQLLLGYPTEKLHWWHCRDTHVYEKPDLVAASVSGYCAPNKLIPHRRGIEMKGWILENLWAPMAARHLERTIATVRPDVIWVLLFAWTIPVVERVRWPVGARIHASLCDFPDTNGMKRSWGAARCQRAVDTSFRLLRRAESCSGGGHGMVDEINLRAGRQDGLVVHSGFEPHHLAALKSAVAQPDATKVIRIAYIGTIISDKDFFATLTALKKVRAQIPQKIILEFFGGRNYQAAPWYEPDWMKEHGMYTDDGLVAALEQCSWGITVMDSSGEDPQYSRFSFPNKVGTYLSGGVPVLGFGHPTSSLAHIMNAHRLGRFTPATDPGELESFWLESLRLPSPRAAFRDDILRCARTEFNGPEMRTKLWRLWGAPV